MGLTSQEKRVEYARTKITNKREKKHDQNDYHSAGYYRSDSRRQQSASLPGEQPASMPGTFRALNQAR